MSTQTTEIAYPVLDSQATESLINGNVAEADRSGDLQTDLKKALISLLGLSGSNYALDDLWKRYQLSSSVTGDGDVIGPPSRTPPGHGGQHPKHFLPPGRIRNPDNATPFPGAGGGGGGGASYNLSAYTFDAQYTKHTGSPFGAGGNLWNDDGTKYFYFFDSGTNSGPVEVALDTAYTAQTFSTNQTTIDDWGSKRIRDAQWMDDGLGLICGMLGVQSLQQFDFSTAGGGSAYNPIANSFDHVTPVKTSSAFLTGEENLRSMDMSADGTKIIYVTNDTGKDIIYGTLSTPFDVSTWTRDGKFAPAAGDMTAARFGKDGTILYCLVINTGILHEYALSTAYDVSTASTTSDDSIDLNTNKQASQQSIVSFSFTPDGTQIWTVPYDTIFDQCWVEVYTV